MSVPSPRVGFVSVYDVAPADPEAWRNGKAAQPSALDPLRPDILEHGWPAADVGPEYLMWKERTDKDS